jgi:hypothetical protein
MTRSNIAAILAIALGLVTSAPAPISHAGTGDFRITVDDPGATTVTGGRVRFKMTVTSVDGFRGVVRLAVPEGSLPRGAITAWSSADLKVPLNGSATAVMTIRTLIETPPGVYEIALHAAGGLVTHVAPTIVLTVTPPAPGTITATLSTERPTVGVSEVRISGRGAAGSVVVDTSTFPDGSVHAFANNVSGSGRYTDGPFVLQQLGTYHDVLTDSETGAKTEISYQGVGDFSTSVDRTSEAVTRGEEAKFEVTFKSLSGFAGTVQPAVPDLSRIAGATASWSAAQATPLSLPAVTVRSDDSAAVVLTIKTSSATPPGSYKVNVQGTNGSVTHTAPSEIELTVKE